MAKLIIPQEGQIFEAIIDKDGVKTQKKYLMIGINPEATDGFRKYIIKPNGGLKMEVDEDWFDTELTERKIICYDIL